MTSKTETALLALGAALAAAAAASSGAVAPPGRNEDLLTRLVDVPDGAGLATFLNVLDGDRADSEETLGAQLGLVDSYEIHWRPRIEWIVAGGIPEAREAAFDAGRTVIWDAIKPVVVDGSPTYLGGAVDSVKLLDILSHERTNAAGLPNVKACDFLLELLYSSPDPF